MKRLLFLLILLPTFLLAQTKYDNQGIKLPKNRKKCKNYLTVYKKIPTEIRYQIELDEDGIIHFYFKDKDYLNMLFDKRKDGIAVDIVSSNQYKCDKDFESKSSSSKGFLLPPMYKKEMRENIVSEGDGSVVIRYGVLPFEFSPLNVECNLVIIQRKYLCGYHITPNVISVAWDLLEMGLYKDSLSLDEVQSRNNELSKILKFTIPFKKNSTDFNVQDIEPLYDSLELTDYNITDISIRAYTSVEGTAQSNIRIQSGRAQSIVAALQTYQTPEITSHLLVKENWVELMKDIKGTKFEYLMKLSKEEVKEELKKESILNEMEPILRNHRKALIKLELKIKVSIAENNPLILKRLFDQSIEQENLKEALYIQQIIFDKVKDNYLPSSFIGELEVPETISYGSLLNNFAIFDYEINDTILNANIQNFERLLTILPSNPKIKYNLIALKIKAWKQGSYVDFQALNKQINELDKSNIDKDLIRRLRANYYILLTDYYRGKMDYKNKNISLRKVYHLYSGLNLDDDDLLSFAKYLSHYNKYKWAKSVLYKRAKKIEADENLIFYFLELSIYNYKNIRSSEYRSIILNAIEKNNKRFCNLFLPKPQGGYTFQLLDNEFLKKTYCESCDL